MSRCLLWQFKRTLVGFQTLECKQVIWNESLHQLELQIVTKIISLRLFPHNDQLNFHVINHLFRRSCFPLPLAYFSTSSNLKASEYLHRLTSHWEMEVVESICTAITQSVTVGVSIPEKKQASVSGALWTDVGLPAAVTHRNTASTHALGPNSHSSVCLHEERQTWHKHCLTFVQLEKTKRVTLIAFLKRSVRNIFQNVYIRF